MCSKRHIIIILLLILIGSNNSVNAETSPTSEEKLEVTMPPADVANEATSTPNSPKKITLVLGGGGCRALAEIGVLKVFAQNNIPINYIIGTSAGAIIGALYAANVPLDEIEKMAYDGTLQDKVSPNIFLYIIWSPFSKLIHLVGPKPYAGLSNGAPLEKFLRKKLPNNFSDLKIPFAAVATDLENGNTCMITTGDICKAVVASSAIPVLVRPVTIGNTIFIDGGLKANLPTKCAQLTGADIIVAVPADAPVKTVAKRKFCSMRNLTSRVLDIMEAEIDKYRWQEADLIIYPKITDIPIFTKDPEIIKATIKAGEDAANAALPRLKALLNSKIVHKSTP